MDLFQRINNLYDQLPKKKQKIARYFLDEWQKASFYSIRQIAEQLGVSVSLIVQFCLQLGYSGFQEVKEELQGITSVHMGRHERLLRQQDDQPIPRKVLHTELANLEQTFLANSPEAFAAAAQLLAGARRIYVYGSRTTGAIASILAMHLNELSGNTLFLGNMMGAEYDYLRNLSEEDVFVAVTIPRYAAPTYQTTNYVYTNCNAKILVLTDKRSAPVARMADHALFACTESASFTYSQQGVLLLINTLIAMTADIIGESAYENLKKQDSLDFLL